MSFSPSALASLWNDPTLLGQLLPGVNVQGIQAALQVQEQQAAAPLSQLSRDQQTLSAQAQAYSKVQGALQTVYSDATALQEPTSFHQTGAPTVSASSVLSASQISGETQAAGMYAVNVTSLASPASLYTQSLASSATSSLGWSGGLHVTVDTGLSQSPVTLTVQVNASDSLDTIAQNITSAAAAALPKGTNLSASVLPTSSGTSQGYVLSLNVNGGLTPSQISATSGSTLPSLSWTQSSTYSAAAFTVNGVANQSTTDTANSVIPGVSLNLTGTGSSTVTVAPNPAATANQISQFVSDIQSAIQTIQGQTGQGDPLAGNGALNGIVNQLENALSASVSGQPAGYQSLTDMGLTESYSKADGMSIGFSTSQFTTALENNPGAVTSLFTTSGTGVASQIAQMVNAFTAPSTGILASDQTGIQNQESQLSTQEKALQQSVDMQRTMLQQEFVTSLEEISKNMSQTQYLQAYVAQMNGQGAGGSGSGGSGG